MQIHFLTLRRYFILHNEISLLFYWVIIKSLSSNFSNLTSFFNKFKMHHFPAGSETLASTLNWLKMDFLFNFLADGCVDDTGSVRTGEEGAPHHLHHPTQASQAFPSNGEA